MESKETKNQRGKLTQRDITKMAVRSIFNQSAFNYERMQADGWTMAMLPAL